MTIETPLTAAEQTRFVAKEEHRRLEWTPVFAGALAAAALSFILLTFGVAIGLGVSSTSPSWRDASAALAILSGIYLIPGHRQLRAGRLCCGPGPGAV